MKAGMKIRATNIIGILIKKKTAGKNRSYGKEAAQTRNEESAEETPRRRGTDEVIKKNKNVYLRINFKKFGNKLFGSRRTFSTTSRTTSRTSLAFFTRPSFW